MVEVTVVALQKLGKIKKQLGQLLITTALKQESFWLWISRFRLKKHSRSPHQIHWRKTSGDEIPDDVCEVATECRAWVPAADGVQNTYWGGYQWVWDGTLCIWAGVRKSIWVVCVFLSALICGSLWNSLETPKEVHCPCLNRSPPPTKKNPNRRPSLKGRESAVNRGGKNVEHRPNKSSVPLGQKKMCHLLSQMGVNWLSGYSLRPSVNYVVH